MRQSRDHEHQEQPVEEPQSETSPPPPEPEAAAPATPEERLTKLEETLEKLLPRLEAIVGPL